ncbi:VWA domain-containing protein [Armatimonas sp.]|uniref:VWA domain-containing protein n=1 Tax=Armatimonas sp. TaxID=1872638 RepID=UPI00286B8A2D|nr:VWA domain-containing protein [Armatimonas sp.]
MPYTAEISRAKPTAFCFLIDQSGSMDDPYGMDSGKRKCDAVADAVNRLIATLVLRCAKGEDVRDYFQIAVIGYGGAVRTGFGGQLAGRQFVPISEVADNPLRVETRARKEDDGTGGLIERQVRFPVWFEPMANGNTPMVAAVEEAHQIVKAWTELYPLSYPPSIINISDGEPTDGSPRPAADKLKGLGTNDGKALLFNIHLSGVAKRPVEFPDTQLGLPDEYAQMLFEISSVLPPKLRDEARREGFTTTESSRGFAFNADLRSLVQFLDIGTRTADLR